MYCEVFNVSLFSIFSLYIFRSPYVYIYNYFQLCCGRTLIITIGSSIKARLGLSLISELFWLVTVLRLHLFETLFHNRLNNYYLFVFDQMLFKHFCNNFN